MELIEAGKFSLTKTNFNGIPLNGIPFDGILFLFPFANRTNRIPQPVQPPRGLHGSKGQLMEMEI